LNQKEGNINYYQGNIKNNNMDDPNFNINNVQKRGEGNQDQNNIVINNEGNTFNHKLML